jgi:hypothetical protein
MVRQGVRTHHALLLALFSIVSLLATRHSRPANGGDRGHGSGYPKTQPTFATRS